MKYNALFEYVIRTSGENTDDIDDFDDRDNFWAPIPENLLFERILLEARIITSPEKRKINILDASEKKTHRYLFSNKKVTKCDKKKIQNHNYEKDYSDPEIIDRFLSSGYKGELISKTSINKDGNEIGFFEYIIYRSSNNGFVDPFKLWAKNINIYENYILFEDVIEEFQELFIKGNVSSIEWIVSTKNNAMYLYDAFSEVFNAIVSKNEKNVKSYQITKENFIKNGGANKPKQILRYIIANTKNIRHKSHK